jgi:hypothetical protein
MRNRPIDDLKDLLVAAGEQQDIRDFFLFSKVNVFGWELNPAGLLPIWWIAA